MDGARGEDHFLVGGDILYRAFCYYFDARTTSTFEVQFDHVGVEQQSEIRPRQRWAQKSANGAHASTIRGDIHVDVAGAGAHRPVHVIQNGHAHFAGRLDESWRGWMRILRATDVDGA